MLGLGVFIGIAKKAYTQFDSLFGALKARSTYYENDGKSRSEVSRISSAGILDNATILLTPTAYSDARVHSVKTYTGDELVTNGGFDSSASWGMQSSWSIASGSANYDGISSHYIEQSNVFSANTSYKITFTISNNTDGIISIRDGAASTFVPNTNYSNGTYTFYITSSTNTTLRIYGVSGSGSLSIDNVSVTEADADFDFDRASSATRINSSGLVQDMQSITDPELVTDGDFPNGDNWNEGSSWTIADNKATATANGYLIQNNTFLALSGQTYSLTYTISNTNDASLQLAGGSNPFGATNLPRTNGTHTVYLTTINTTTNLQFYSNGFRGDLSNVSSKNITFSTDVDLARINYDSNGENGHILLEPTSTNLIPYSEDFSEWTAGGNTIIYPNYTAPDGTNSAYKVSGSSGALTYAASATSTQTRTIWAKTVSGTGQAHLCSYFGNTNNLKTITNEWQRFEVNGTTTSTGVTTFYAIDFRGSTDLTEIILWGAQVENLSYATSYIPTLTGSTVTRATEKLTGSGNSTLINSREGVLYAEIKVPQNYGSNSSIAISNGTTDEYIKFIILTTNNIRAEIKGSLNAQQRETSFTYDAYTKIAISYSAAECKFFINGSQIGTTITTHTLPSGLDTLEFARGDGQVNFYGKCKALAVFDRALTDQELTDLTT